MLYFYACVRTKTARGVSVGRGERPLLEVNVQTKLYVDNVEYSLIYV